MSDLLDSEFESEHENSKDYFANQINEENLSSLIQDAQISDSEVITAYF